MENAWASGDIARNEQEFEMFVMFFWVYIDTKQAENYAWPRREWRRHANYSAAASLSVINSAAASSSVIIAIYSTRIYFK